MTQRNFLIVALCDNDFGMNLEFSIKSCINDHGFNMETEAKYWRQQVISGALAYDLIRRKSQVISFDNLKRVHNYLQNHMKVFYSRHRPVEDHDGGSAYVDLNLNLIYRY